MAKIAEKRHFTKSRCYASDENKVVEKSPVTACMEKQVTLSQLAGRGNLVLNFCQQGLFCPATLAESSEKANYTTHSSQLFTANKNSV